VTITDMDAASLDTAPSRIAANLRELGEGEGAVARVRPCATLAETVRDADYVVEAVSENLPLKQNIALDSGRHTPTTISAKTLCYR
jgi:3-hydroxybutyryl-CoA dehydrogenase